MNENYSNVANSENKSFTSLNSLIEFPENLLSWNQISSSWQKTIEKAIFSNFNPHYLIFPPTITSLAQIIKLAYQNDWKILPAGNGNKLQWGNLVRNIDLVISTTKLNRVINHAVEDLTVTVESGVKLADLQAILAEKGQFLPIDPSYPDNATIGGIVATADTGSLRQRYGGIRDLILGLSFVRYDGEIAKAGGKVVKNVAGYDLMKLFTGSYGTLGIISEVTFRVYPLAENSQTLILTGEKENIEQIRQIILSSSLTPISADIISPLFSQKLDLDEKFGLIIRFQTIPESIATQVNQLKSWQEKLSLKLVSYSEQDEIILWQKIQQLIAINSLDSAVLCKVGILPQFSVNLLDKCQQFGIINISTGLGKLTLNSENLLQLLTKLRSFCEINQGFLTILEAPVNFKKQIEPLGYIGNALSIMQKLKEKFDPKNIFKPN